ncbi:MAG: hypothetical protein OEZ47_14325, partial [Gammaproteobacteria bacterium]|nr:hypothetical protein [Gammaproteobacteria bacterium]
VEEYFLGTLPFLESLAILYEDEECMAVSYSPKDEKGVVINANAYAAFAYALHYSRSGESELLHKLTKLVAWVVCKQQEDGSWLYMDDKNGTFIDTFHSCFVVKNLIKLRELVPNLPDLDDSIERGWDYINRNLYEQETGLCKRFALNNRKFSDPYVYDLYDQAEYLGLLVDFGFISEAFNFRQHITEKFCKSETWFVRRDFLGRLWGREFQRWGIVPLKYHSFRLDQRVLEETV